MRVLNFEQSGCPSWALDILEELKQDTNNVTRNNVYDRLAMLKVIDKK